MGKDRAIQNVANAAKNVASGQKCSKRIEKKRAKNSVLYSDAK
jgi:hypothetical protein